MATLASDAQLETLYQAAQTAVTDAKSAYDDLVAAVDNVLTLRATFQTKRQAAIDAVTQFTRRAFGITPGATFRAAAIIVIGDEERIFEELRRRLA